MGIWILSMAFFGILLVCSVLFGEGGLRELLVGLGLLAPIPLFAFLHGQRRHRRATRVPRKSKVSETDLTVEEIVSLKFLEHSHRHRD